MLNGVNLTSNFAITEASQGYVLRAHCDTLHINSRNYAHGVISFCSGYLIKHFLITNLYPRFCLDIEKVHQKTRRCLCISLCQDIKKNNLLHVAFRVSDYSPCAILFLK